MRQPPTRPVPEEEVPEDVVVKVGVVLSTLCERTDDDSPVCEVGLPADPEQQRFVDPVPAVCQDAAGPPQEAVLAHVLDVPPGCVRKVVGGGGEGKALGDGVYVVKPPHQIGLEFPEEGTPTDQGGPFVRVRDRGVPEVGPDLADWLPSVGRVGRVGVWVPRPVREVVDGENEALHLVRWLWLFEERTRCPVFLVQGARGSRPLKGPLVSYQLKGQLELVPAPP